MQRKQRKHVPQSLIDKGLRGHPTSEIEFNRRYDDVKLAIELGAVSYKRISVTTQLSIQQIQNLFKKFPDLHDIYKRAVFEVRLHAAGNIMEAIMDGDHPKNFEASKFFITRYKTPLEEQFERNDQDETTHVVTVENTEKGSNKINISFSSQSKRTKIED